MQNPPPVSDPLGHLQRWIAEGKSAALATVVATWGSSPRPVGSHMAVLESGDFVGSVSGGCIEGAVVDAARAVIASGKAQRLEFGVSNEMAWEVGLACGGRIEVLVAPATRESVAEIINNRVPLPRMVIVGAVHIAQALAPMAQMAGFDVTVIDPREAFARSGALAGIAALVEWPDEAMKKIAPDTRTAVVSLTHDPKLDDPALAAALRSDAFYIGALGSKKTHAKRLERLAAAGFLAADTARIHGPVGLDINALTPAEIAVSIMAQVIEKLRAPAP